MSTLSLHRSHLQSALTQAHSSPLSSTNFRIGAVILDAATQEVLVTGYTGELPGNTHAEEVCFSKLIAARSKHLPQSSNVEDDGDFGLILYTTMEPCGERLSGKPSCVSRILETRRFRDGTVLALDSENERQRVFGKGVVTVVFGVKEPEDFIKENVGLSRLRGEGVECVYVEGMEDEIIRVAKAGHKRET